MSPRKPGRPTALPPRRLVARVRRIVARHAGKPCPTSAAMAAMLDANESAVRMAVRMLEAKGELEIQRTAWIGGLRRRMRVKLKDEWRAWTALTARQVGKLGLNPDDLLTGDAHHRARVLMAGRYDARSA